MKKEEILPGKVELVGDIEEISKQIGEELSKKVDDDNKFDVVRYFVSNILVYSDLSPEETQNVLDSLKTQHQFFWLWEAHEKIGELEAKIDMLLGDKHKHDEMKEAKDFIKNYEKYPKEEEGGIKNT